MILEGWIVTKDGKPQALDHASGGYPYDASTPQQVKIWRDADEAARYSMTMNSGAYGEFKIAPCRLELKHWSAP